MEFLELLPPFFFPVAPQVSFVLKWSCG